MQPARPDNHDALEIVSRRIAEAPPQLIAIFDIARDRLIFAGRGASDFFGIMVEELLQYDAARLALLIHPDDRETVPAHYHALCAGTGESEAAYELRLRAASGAWRRVDCHAVILQRDGSGAPLQILLIGADITGRRADEAELAHLLRETLVLNHVYAATASSLNPQEVLTTLCRELAQALDLPQAAFALLRPETADLAVIAEYCAPGRPSALGRVISVAENAATQQAITQREPIVVANAQTDPRHQGFHPLGRERGTISLLIVPLVYGDRVIGTLGLDALEERAFSEEEIRLARNVAAAAGQAIEQARLHDAVQQELVERRRAEAALRENEERLRQAKEAAEVANRAKDEFLSRMSHELRTPLNAILGFAQLLASDPLNDEQRESIDYILKAGDHLLNLINEVLDIARIESGHLTLEYGPTNLNELIVTAIELLRPSAVEQSVRLEFADQEAKPVTIRGDRRRILQVLLNLCSNAIKYNRPWGLVTVRLQSDGHTARIEVADTGYGIAADQIARLFTPFERLNAAQRGVEGTGIGLALSRRLVELMGGGIGVTSEVGIGSVFRVELPYTTAAAAAPTPLLAERSQAVTGERTIVLIDDNGVNRRLIERVLKVYPWVRLQAAGSGGAGLALIESLAPDLVLLDLHLPDMPGEEVLRRMQESPALGTAPVIVLSADVSDTTRRRVLSAGARDFVPKPFEIRQLTNAVESLLERVPGE
jgi:signal transduction histidine kinase/ActR/RegA family two-component response regulator